MKYSKVLFLSITLFSVGVSAGAATLSVSPVSGTYNVNNIFQLDILVDTQSQPIDGVDINALNYNPAILEVQDQNQSTAGVQITPGSLMPNSVFNSVNVQTGKIVFSQLTAGGQTYNGQGILASINFKVLQTGIASLNFDFISGQTTDSNVSSAGADLLAGVTNGSYSLIESPSPSPTPTPIASSTPPPSSGGGGGGGGGSSYPIPTMTPPIVTPTPVTFPNGTLVKSTSSPKVYLIQYGLKRWITTYEIFKANKFDFKNVITVSNTTLSSYPDGATIASKLISTPVPTASPSTTPTPIPVKNEKTSSLVNGDLIKGLKPAVYLLIYGKKRHITTYDVFISRGYDFPQVRIISDSLLNSIPTGTDINNSAKHSAGTLIRKMGNSQIYLVANNGQISPLSYQQFIDGKYDFRKVVNIWPGEFAQYVIGQ